MLMGCVGEGFNFVRDYYFGFNSTFYGSLDYFGLCAGHKYSHLTLRFKCIRLADTFINPNVYRFCSEITWLIYIGLSEGVPLNAYFSVNFAL